ncbi:peptidoglycan editing factor PgeF [Nocardioides dubius]|uniref:Purine nucleoside phosphorylase n=1 Tax=Nocardioides dubius TaxID=317019 RepID=A0ABP4E952_9ACTN
MYAYRDRLDPVELGFTDRLGGVSGAPWASLNLALDGGDAPAAVAENWRLLVADFAPGARLADMHQVHGNAVAVIADDDAPRPTSDALVTATPGVVLAVRAADCVPILLADPVAGVIGAAHAGRNGVASGVASAAATAMRELGATEITAWIGPHVCGACYEVPQEMHDSFVAQIPAAAARTSWGTPALDLGTAVADQLRGAGVAVVDAARCTRESADLYSFRRDGEHAGRHAGVITLAPATRPSNGRHDE